MKKTKRTQMIAVVLSLIMIAALSASSFAEGPQGGPPQGDMQMGQPGGPQGRMRVQGDGGKRSLQAFGKYGTQVRIRGLGSGAEGGVHGPGQDEGFHQFAHNVFRVRGGTAVTGNEQLAAGGKAGCEDFEGRSDVRFRAGEHGIAGDEGFERMVCGGVIHGWVVLSGCRVASGGCRRGADPGV